MATDNFPTEPHWRWRGSPVSGYVAEIHGADLTEAQLLALSHVTVHRRDGCASRHRVIHIAQRGNRAAVRVAPKGEHVPGYPFPPRPPILWNNSRIRSRTKHNGHRATICRFRREGRNFWTYVIDGQFPPGRPAYSSRNQARQACEAQLLTH